MSTFIKDFIERENDQPSQLPVRVGRGSGHCVDAGALSEAAWHVRR